MPSYDIEISIYGIWGKGLELQLIIPNLQFTQNLLIVISDTKLAPQNSYYDS